MNQGNNFGERLKNYIYKVKELNASTVSQMTGLDKSRLATTLSGKHSPNLSMLEKLHDVFPECNLHYLITGLGPVTTVSENMANETETPYAIRRDQIEYLKEEIRQEQQKRTVLLQQVKDLQTDKNDLRMSLDMYRKLNQRLEKELTTLKK